ncbi:MAG: helix-turn-helix transcriptional regulator [Clostridia bacterium]|nr:helix-turn-helix transcriptional regulator [Clostridia bacterium]
MNREATILRDRRKELGFSQQALATEVGLQVRQYQRFEYGQQLLSNANMRLGLLICAALELDPYEVIFENGLDIAVPRKKTK